MLNIHPLYSSSSGNMFHIGTEKTNILLDVGVSYKAINEGLKQIDKSLMDISAVLKTHEHVYHIKGLSLLCMKNNIPMGFYAFSRATTMDELRQEISYIKKKLVDIPVTYPVYLDLETDFWTLNTDEDYSQNKDFFQSNIRQDNIFKICVDSSPLGQYFLHFCV